MGGVGSGGPNGGPQYNPANVNLLGGNGTNGDYSGFAYGQNKTLNESRVAGNAAVSSISGSKTYGRRTNRWWSKLNSWLT